MKTHLILIGAVSLLGTSLLTTSDAANTSEYLHFTRHRDSNGKLLMAPTQHQAAPSVMEKTVMPSQPKTFERRSTDWGMSVNDVKEIEPIQSTWDLQAPVLGEQETRVAYQTQIEGIDAALTYSFYEDHLGQAKYVFESQHEDAADYVNDFHTVERWISQSYGQPISVQEIWLDTLYQYDKSLWGQAVQRGHLVMVGEWKSPGTDIVLVLDGGNDEVGLVADFASTTFMVPVSLDIENQEERMEAEMEDATTQEMLPGEIGTDPVVEDASAQDEQGPVDVTHIGGSGEFHHDTEMTSPEPGSQLDELEEIEHMLNEEYPIDKPMAPAMEGSLMEGSPKEPVLDDAVMESVPVSPTPMTSEEIGEEVLDERPMGDQHLMDEAMSEDSSIEPVADVQAKENSMDMSGVMPLEPSIEELGVEMVPLGEPVSDMAEGAPGEPFNEGHLNDMPSMEEPGTDMSEAMPVEPSHGESEAEAKGLEEPVMDMSEAMPLEPSHDESAAEAKVTHEPMGDMSEAMPLKPSNEGQASEAQPIVEATNDPMIEEEIEELEPQHL